MNTKMHTYTNTHTHTHTQSERVLRRIHVLARRWMPWQQAGARRAPCHEVMTRLSFAIRTASGKRKRLQAPRATYPPAGHLLVSHQLVSPSPRQGGHLPHLALPHRPSPHRVAETQRWRIRRYPVKKKVESIFQTAQCCSQTSGTKTAHTTFWWCLCLTAVFMLKPSFRH